MKLTNTDTGKEEFVKLVEGHRGIIFKICNSYCPDKNAREDLAQEIIFQLWRSYPNFNNAYKFSTWMYRIALNIAISFYRKEKKLVKTIALEEHDDVADHRDDHIEQNISRLQQFINELKELDKALMILYLEERNHKETAEILGITETNVATRISRIKDKLKQKFSTLDNL